MELFLQRLVDGLSEGSVYALLALGLVIIYRGTGHLNFAQGEMALFSTYAVRENADDKLDGCPRPPHAGQASGSRCLGVGAALS